tara:strand:- start:1737 stop:2273 length:537 start_codon:yes stop_codon:yes gene_type:complete
MGGTFDPPHIGHLRTSLIAKEILKLDEIWWVISLKNPLKKETISSFDKRLKKIQDYLNGKKIKVSDLENKLKTPYTCELLNFLKKKLPTINFVWIMGIDNLENFHLWKNWKSIFHKVPIAIFDRPFYSLFVKKSKCLNFFGKYRLDSNKVNLLKNKKPPCWVFIKGWPNDVSSTKLKV